MANDSFDSTYFRPLAEQSHEGRVTARYESDPSTGGPWAAGLQHGGPPSALLVHVAERLTAAHTGRSDLAAMRLTADFVGPVPVADLEVEARVVRAARSAVLVEGAITAGGRTSLLGRVWLLATTDTSAVVSLGAGDDRPEPAAHPREPGGRFPYYDTIEWRAVSGSIRTPGPGTVWARPLQALVPGATMSGLQRAALVGDSASGISSELDWGSWSFANVDLAVHLHRQVEGEWLQMDAATTLGPAGAALARSTISDVRGTVGSTGQTLVLAPR